MAMLILRRILPILAAVLYVISPVDVMPDFLPGLGWVDDVLVVGALLWYLTTRQRGMWTRGSAGPRPEELTVDFDQMDPYTLLEISPRASPDEIKAAYKRAVSRYHPDKVTHLGKEFQELAHKKLLAIQQAYDILQSKGR